MKHATLLCGACLMALLTLGCNQAAPDTRAADTQALRDLEAGWNQDWASKDAEKLIAHYADDAVLMAPGVAAARGKDAIRKGLAEMVADPALSLKFQASMVEVARSGDVGYTQGSYTLTVTDSVSKKPITDHGSYVTTYRKQADGLWKAVADIASSEAPPAPPAGKPAKK
jgi:uncharacterized protein (TIGR02246 family)